jgi:hypothetical protein
LSNFSASVIDVLRRAAFKADPEGVHGELYSL